MGRSSLRRQRVVGVVAAGMVVLFAPAVAQAQEGVPAATVTDDGTLARAHEAASVLIDRDDPEMVYMASVEMLTGECRFHVSPNGGQDWVRFEAPSYDGWTDCGLGSASPRNVRTELAQAPDGTLFYVHHGNEPGGSRSVLLGRSGDGGATWETTAIHEAPEADSLAEVELNWLAHIAIDPDDPRHLVAMWRRSYPSLPDEETGRPTRPWMAESTDGGQTWGDATRMFEDDIGFDGPRPVIVDGAIHAFHRVRPGPDAPDDANDQVAVSVSTDDGETWDRTVIAEAGDVSEPVPVHDPDRDALYAVWHDNSNGNLDAYFSRSQDGDDWIEPVRLNDDPREDTTGQFYPQMALSPDGRLDVAWYDYRDDTYAAPVPEEEGDALNLFNNMGKQQSVYAVTSEDGGATWGPNRRVNDVRIDRTIGLWDPTYFFQVPLAVASSAGSTLVAWSDTRNGDALTGTQDIVTAALAAVESDDSAWLWFGLGGAAGVAAGAGLGVWILLLVMRRRADAQATPAGDG